jgi:hypothetical protein
MKGLLRRPLAQCADEVKVALYRVYCRADLRPPPTPRWLIFLISPFNLFIRFDQGAIEGWLQRYEVRRRFEELRASYDRWAELRGGDGRHQQSLAYGMLHSLSHALMAEIALVCGYPASAPRLEVCLKRSGLCRSRTELK